MNPNINKTPFTVPDGYFDHLQEDVMKRIEGEIEKKSEVKNRMRIYAVAASVAASIALLITFMVWPKPQTEELASYNDEDEMFYQWLYLSDKTTLLAEAIYMSEYTQPMEDEIDYSSEDEQIIRFLERDMDILALQYSIYNQ